MSEVESRSVAQPDSNHPDLRSVYLEVLLLSLASLFFELLVIRLFAAEVRAFSVFKTFPLVTCFVGIGLGLGLRSKKLFQIGPLAFLVFAAILKHVEILGSGHLVFPSSSVWTWIIFDEDMLRFLLRVISFSLIMLYVLFGPFLVSASLGSGLGLALDKLRPVPGYSINVAGSILGSALFTFFCFFSLPPEPLVLVPLLIQTYYLKGNIKIKESLSLIAAALLFFWTPAVQDKEFAFIDSVKWDKQDTLWSPYHRIDWRYATQHQSSNNVVGIRVNSNHNFYQQFFRPFNRDEEIDPGLEQVLKERELHDSFAYNFCKPESILILGCGTGADVAHALKSGATSIEGVDIDPAIIRLGREFNPAFKDPRVSIYCDDARHYIETCKKKYDLIVYCLLDSQSVNGYGSSLRLDNYVYTKEGIAKAFKLLKEDGYLVLSFASAPQWTIRHIGNTLEKATGKEPLSFQNYYANSLGNNYYFVVGKKDIVNTYRRSHIPPPFKEANLEFKSSRFLEDDWPYLYVNPQVLDIPLISVLAIFLSAALFACRHVILKPASPGYWQMFFLGAGFMMLELQAISRLSVLYGATWISSSVVINGCLIMILLGTLVVLKKQQYFQKRVALLYCAHMLAILVSWSISSEFLLSQSGRTGAATVLALLPVLTASLIFSASFARLSSPSRGLSFNLFGAVAGAVLEFLSNYLGIRAMLIVGAALYLLSWLCCSRAKSQASKQDTPPAPETV